MASGLDQWLGKLEGHNEIGEALTAQLQKSEEEVQQFIGGRQAFKVGSEKVGALGAVVDEDLNTGKLSFASELEAAAYAKKTIIRATEILLNLCEGAQSKEIAAAGKVAALKESRDVVMRHCMVAKARADQLKAAKEELEAAAEAVEEPTEAEPPKAAEEATRGRERLPGQHPGRSSLDDRRQEAAAQEAHPKTGHPETDPEPPSPKPKAKPKAKSRPPKR